MQKLTNTSCVGGDFFLLNSDSNILLTVLHIFSKNHLLYPPLLKFFFSPEVIYVFFRVLFAELGIISDFEEKINAFLGKNYQNL